MSDEKPVPEFPKHMTKTVAVEAATVDHPSVMETCHYAVQDAKEQATYEALGWKVPQPLVQFPQVVHGTSAKTHQPISKSCANQTELDAAIAAGWSVTPTLTTEEVPELETPAMPAKTTEGVQ